MLTIKELEVLQQVSEVMTSLSHHSFLERPSEGVGPAALDLDTACCWALDMEAQTQAILKLRRLYLTYKASSSARCDSPSRDMIDGGTVSRCYELLVPEFAFTSCVPIR